MLTLVGLAGIALGSGRVGANHESPLRATPDANPTRQYFARFTEPWLQAGRPIVRSSLLTQPTWHCQRRTKAVEKPDRRAFQPRRPAAARCAGPGKGQLSDGRAASFRSAGACPLPGGSRGQVPALHFRSVPSHVILRVRLSRDHVSAISGITTEGTLLLMAQERAYCTEDVVGFLKHLLRHIPGLLLVIWDGSPIHRGEPIKTFLANGGAERIRLESLPGYAPDLNPDEGIWNYLKRVELRNMCCPDVRELRQELRLAVHDCVIGFM